MKKKCKSPGKSPVKAALLVGSGYGALMTAEAMAQSGIPLVWVTGSPNFLKFPRGFERFKDWPEDLEFQFRPLYLRVTRHPLVTPMVKARIESISASSKGYRAVVVKDPEYVDYDLCTGCGRCMEVCPLDGSGHPPLFRSPPYVPSRALELDKRKLGACRASCPLGVNVQAYMALAAQSRFEEALAVIREDNPLPGICGRVCHHPCEASCRRGDLDEVVAICSVKRFLSDYEAQSSRPALQAPDKPKRSEKIAVVGSGPGGLTAAYYLRRAGFPVTIFEALPEPGGMLRVGINAFRLPRKVLYAEIQAIKDAGVEISTNSRIENPDKLFEEGYKAVLMCIGAHRDMKLNIPGEDAEGVYGAVKMLRAFNVGETIKIGYKVAVIGGGNSAIDAARTAIRLGAETVTIYYRRERQEMPADEKEIHAAEEEGIRIEYRVAPTRIVSEGGRITGLELVTMKLGQLDDSGRRRPTPIEGSEFVAEADTVVAAIGQMPDLGGSGNIQTDKRGNIVVNEEMCTSCDGVFAAGDVVTGPSTVVESMAAGRLAAGRIIEFLTGKPSPFVQLTPDTRGVGDYVEISEDTLKQSRPPMSERQPKVRRKDFDEVELGFTVDQAVFEAKRCLQCGSCCECRVCETVCRDIGAIDHFRLPERLEVECPAVIVADDAEFPRTEDLDEKNVFRAGDFKGASDLMDILVVGSAAAGMGIEKAASLRQASVPRTRTAARKGDERMRIGVFICKCNGTLASEETLGRIRDMAAAVPGVEHCELIFSACHPKGADTIAAATKSHKLNRIIMASCVCCPLEFQCISCNDQRNRARIHLFNRLGLDRSRFEMINIRDHLAGWEMSDDEIVDRARDMLRGSFIRSRFMGPLRQGRTEIGKNILILGGSQVGISCAMNLDSQGFRVRVVHRAKLAEADGFPSFIAKRKIDDNIGGSIVNVEEADIESISGHMGDFTAAVKVGGSKKNWKADIVCLTDENLLPLAINEEMSGLKKFYRYDFAFFHTPQLGLYRVMPRTLKRVSPFEAGAALAAQVATAAAEAYMADHELSPRIDPELCRGCGRCVEICPFEAIHLVPNDYGFFTAEVIRHNCVGCGGCVGRCPVTALDMPYYSNKLLEEIVVGALAGGR